MLRLLMLLSNQLSFGAIMPCLAREVELYLKAEPQAQFYSVIFVPSELLDQTWA